MRESPGACPVAEEGEIFRTHIGGSALPEGVMMRGRLSWAVAVREPSGAIYLEEHDLARAGSRPSWMGWPLVRGCVSFVESMVLSYRATKVAVEHAYDADGETYASLLAAGCDSAARPAGPGDAVATPADDGGAPGQMPSWLTAASMVGGLLLGVLLFVVLPVGVTNLLVGQSTPDNALLWNLVEGLLRVTILVAYVGGIGLLPDVARTYGYHGAEHQSIHCFERGAPLTPADAARYSRLHVRCGTAFLLMTVLVAVLVNTLLPVSFAAAALGLAGLGFTAFVVLSRLALVPVVAGVSYELTVRWAGSRPGDPLVRLLLWPGLQLQRLTTRVPDESMLECAIVALTAVHDREAGERRR